MLGCLLWNTAIAGLMAGAVLMIGRSIRLTPATRHALWLVVLVKLLSPIGLIWSVPLPFETPLPVAQTTPTEVVPEPHRETIRVVWVENIANSTTAEINSDQVTIAEVQPLETAEPKKTTLQQIEQVMIWLLLVWAAGSLVVAWKYLSQTVRFAWVVRQGKPAGGWLMRDVARLARQVGVKMPQVRIVAGLASPVVWCLFRPVLLWPKGLQNHLASAGREAVIVHELAHLRRRDHLWRWLELFAAIIHWWNPLFRLARREMRFHAELACDAWVMTTLPDHRRAYAEALLDVCQRLSRPAAPTPAVGVGGEGKKMLERRLSMIMRETVPCRVARGAKFFVVLLAMAAIPAWTLGQAKPEAKHVEKPADAKPLIISDLTLAPVNAEFLTLLDSEDYFTLFQAAQAPNPTPEQQKEQILKEQQRLAELLKALDQQIRANERLKAERLAEAAAALQKANEPRKENPNRYRVQLQPEVAEIEAKIQQLKSQLEKLRADKAATDKKKPAPKQVEGIIELDGLRLYLTPQKENPPATGVKKPEPNLGLKVEATPLKVEFDWADQLQKTITQKQKDGTIIWKIVEDGEAKKPVPPKPVVKGDTKVEGKGIFIINMAQGPQVINLTRTTYQLPKEKAVALEAFLKEHLKAKILETKVDEKGLTVTTTPETQKAITSLIGLMTKEKTSANIELEITEFPYPLKELTVQPTPPGR